MSEEVHDVDYESLDDASLGVNMLAGAAAGISEHVVMFPADFVKTRMQVVREGGRASTGYPGLVDAVRRISATEGVKNLYRGVTSVIMGAGPAHALYFGTYEFMKSTLSAGPELSVFATAGAGATATMVADAFMNPFDVVKQRMQIEGSARHSLAATFRNVYRTEGVSSFFVSYPTTLMMNVPFTALQFTTYEFSKGYLNPTNKYDPLSHIVAGGFAGGVAASLTTPLDVCKTLLQTRGTSSDVRVRRARSMSDAMRIIYSSYGVLGFMRGAVPRALAVMPGNAVCWLCYESFRLFLHTYESVNMYHR